MKAELERIRDQLKCSLNMGGLKGAAEWVVGELDRLLSSLPVGVPDESMVEMAAAAYDRAAHAGATHEQAWHEALSVALSAPAAPAVKDEQVRYSVDDLQKEALNAGLQYVREPDDHYVTGTTEQALDFIRNMIGVDIRLTDAAPSLPAAGSEEVEVVASRDHDPINAPYLMFCLNKWWPCSERQLNAARDRNYPIIDLSARQSAGERVSVPRELLERVYKCCQFTMLDLDAAEIRALLASQAHRND